MSMRLRMPDYVIGQGQASGPGLQDHLIRTASVRRLQADAIASGVHWAWTNVRRIVTSRLAPLVRRFILEPHARGRRRRVAIAQLRALDDHLLKDIGLARGQIEMAVDGMLARRGNDIARPFERVSPDEERFSPAEQRRHELPLAA